MPGWTHLGGIKLHGLFQKFLCFMVQTVMKKQVGSVNQGHFSVLWGCRVQRLTQTLQRSCPVPFSTPEEPGFVINQPVRHTHLKIELFSTHFQTNNVVTYLRLLGSTPYLLHGFSYHRTYLFQTPATATLKQYLHAKASL